ncbi:YkgJ family cysteine cluster protein [Fundidesulfovibrio putealis]|uniref:YkgJ family cysteine cluster protein n=1 Tax=Fundidesulfovibrio putealis TaxID=270496 RepID=UPI000418FF68|nr:YkgJ family cysteine cluster protein [Fundidesulfovibrio putealis]
MESGLQTGQPPKSWLTGIRKAQALLDAAARLGIARMAHAEGPGGAGLACRPGCDQCCRESVIPVSAPEVGAALTHLLERTPGPVRGLVLARLRGRKDGECPFLLDSTCSVYADRFLACRQFHIFGAPCRDGGNVWELRRADIPFPDPEIRLQGLRVLASLSGVPAEDMTPGWLEDFLKQVSPPLHSWDLRSPRGLLALLDDAQVQGSPFFFGPQE